VVQGKIAPVDNFSATGVRKPGESAIFGPSNALYQETNRWITRPKRWRTRWKTTDVYLLALVVLLKRRNYM